MQASRYVVTTFAAIVAASTLVAAPQAHSAEPVACGASHPSMAQGTVCSAPAGVDPNTFIVQPPASVSWTVRAPNRNGDHPAVVVARMQRSAELDANTFIVQPPVAVQWTVREDATMLAGATLR